MFRHIIPNCLAPILVLFTMSIPAAIMAEAGLSFLGVGAQPPTPSWGLMVNEAQAVHLLRAMGLHLARPGDPRHRARPSISSAMGCATRSTLT